MTYDFTKQLNDFAIYLPALQDTFVKIGSGVGIDSKRDMGGEWFNFLSDHCSAFYYPFALYSAGVGLTTKAATQSMLATRDSRTMILTDSGGYQITKDKSPLFINFPIQTILRK